VGIAVMKKAMGSADQGSNLMNQMLDKVNEWKAAAQVKLPHLSSNIDDPRLVPGRVRKT